MRRNIIIFAVVVVSIMFAGTVPAQHLEYVDSKYWTIVSDVEVQDNYAYYCYTPGLVIYDISDPENPEFVSRLYIPGSNNKISMAGNHIVIFGEHDKLRLVNIIDPYNPYIVGELPYDHVIHDVYPQGDTLFAAVSPHGFLAIDISNPGQPEIITSFDTGGRTESIVIEDTLLYAAGRPYYSENIFMIISIADIHNPYIIGSLDCQTGGCKDMIVDGNYVYLSDTINGFTVIDISDKRNPQFVVQLEDTTYPWTIEKKDNFLFMNFYYDTLQVYDISNPEQPQFLLEYESDIAFRDLNVQDDILYVAGYNNGFSILDISDVNNITAISEHPINSVIENVFLANDYLCVNDYGNQLLVHKLENQAQPEVISTIPTPTAARYHFVDSTTIYVLGNDKLGIIDMSNPVFPSQPIYHDFIGNFPDIFVQRPYLYLSEFTAGVHIYHQRSFNNLEFISTMYWSQITGNIKIENNIGYISNAPHVRIYDFTNPTHPTLMSYYLPNCFVQYLWVKDGFVYSKGYDEADDFLNIYDCTDPYNPEFVDSLRFPGSITHIEFTDNLVYISDLVGGLHVYDITDMYHPVFLDSYRTPDAVVEFCVDGNYIYIADISSLIILRLTQTGLVEEKMLPKRFALLPNYPNPFNAQTTISYELSKSTEVTLDIYDILGRKVSTLFDGQQAAGNHSLIWNAKDFASGIYFYKLATSEFEQSEKMILLK